MNGLVIEKFIGLTSDIEESKLTNVVIAEEWRMLSVEWLRGFFGINSQAVKKLFEWGSDGYNWKRLHPTKTEKKRSRKTALSEFTCKLHYCSDRMSFDRWARCHWLFNIGKNTKETT